MAHRPAAGKVRQRAVSYTHLDVYKRQFLMLATHTSKNTSASHLNKFYVYFDEIKNKKFDGMIITGAPVENLEYCLLYTSRCV